MPTSAPRYLSGEQVAALLPPPVALRAVQRLFSQPRDHVAVPERIHLPVPGAAPPRTIGLYMPAATERFIGVKLAHLMPQRRPNVEAEIFLYDAQTGRLLLWGDGKPLTALRTAAVSVAAALRLLPACGRLAVLGSGVQAAAHITAFASAYPMLRDVRVVARSAEALSRLLALLPAPLRGRVQPAALEQALRGAHCVVTTTPAPQPLFSADLLPQRCHVAAIGSAAPAMNELPPPLFPRARVWVDTRAALKESGDCLAALSAGWTAERLQGDLFDLLGGAAPPAVDGISLFKSVGHAAQDLALLIELWERAGAGPSERDARG